MKRIILVALAILIMLGAIGTDSDCESMRCVIMNSLNGIVLGVTVIAFSLIALWVIAVIVIGRTGNGME